MELEEEGTADQPFEGLGVLFLELLRRRDRCEAAGRDVSRRDLRGIEASNDARCSSSWGSTQPFSTKKRSLTIVLSPQEVVQLFRSITAAARQRSRGPQYAAMPS